MPNHPAFLKVHKNTICPLQGDVPVLQWARLRRRMNMENFVTGCPANESAFRQIVRRALGAEKADYFFERYLDYFFTHKDADFIRSLGMNLVRLSFNYRHFEDDMNPR